MQTLLRQLNAMSGVVGSMAFAPEGRLLAQEFPPGFDASALAEAARLATEAVAGLGTATGPVRLLDLRYGAARIVVRPMAGANLLFLCTSGMNLQLLSISASVAAPRLEKLAAEQAAAPPAAPAAAAAHPSRLHAIVQRINELIERKKLDPFQVRGEISLKAGFALGFIDAETPDDPDKVAKLRAAASAVLREPL